MNTRHTLIARCRPDRQWARVTARTATGALTALLLAAAPAQAQETSETETLEEIVVVGSHISRSGFESSAPVTVISSDLLEATGTTNVGDLLQTLPQNVATLNNANGAFTLASAGLNLTDLRNLGIDRTLVLINGRRFVSGVSPAVGYGVDLNALPTAMIERIEVLTGGASAIYGSDAVAGVVNIVTKTNFQGVDLDVQVGASSEGDKNKEDINVTVGGSFGDGGHAWFSIGWSDDDELLARDRAFSNTDLAVYDLDGDGFGETDDWLGSSFLPIGRFGSFLGDGNPFRSGLADRENSDRFNRADFRMIFTPITRRFGSAMASYPLTERLEVFTELNYSLVESRSQLEPFALDINDNIFIQSRGGTGGHDVASSLLIPQLLRDNLLAAGITDINQLGLNLAARRLVEFGPRLQDISRTTLRAVTGFDYELTDNLKLQGYYTYGQTDQDQSGNGQINIERAGLALDVELAPDGTTIQCVSEVARLQGCVPFNPFGLNTITPQAVAYLQAPSNFKAQVEQEVFNLLLSGTTPLQLPAGNVGFAVGAEYRDEGGSTTPGGFEQTGITAGNAVQPTDGSFDVLEFFGEISLPVHEKVSLDAAVRTGDYSTVGNQFTWKLGADVSVHETLRLRATTSESVRAPNVADLFRGAGETFRTIQDPCDGVTATTTGNVAVNCRSIPVIADRIADQGVFALTQVERQSTGGFISGNPNVREEEAEAFTVGAVWQPNFADTLSVSVDWYDIRIDDVIAVTPRTTVAERCYSVDPSAFDPTCGGTALRDTMPGTGGLVSVDSSSSNENILETSGVDVELAYRLPLFAGDLGLSLYYNYLVEYNTTGIVDGDVDVDAGEVLFPRNRAVASLRYDWNEWSVHWRSRYWHRVKDSNTPDLTNENSDVFGNPLAPGKNEVPSYTYSDLSLGYNNGPWRFSAGVNNLFDKEPPLLTQTSQYGNTGTNTAAEAYDPIGRAWYVSFGYQLDSL